MQGEAELGKQVGVELPRPLGVLPPYTWAIGSCQGDGSELARAQDSDQGPVSWGLRSLPSTDILRAG